MARDSEMNWHEEVLDAKGRKAAARLAPVVSSEFYLAGGTALALRLGHRISLDLELFSPDDPLEEARRASLLKALAGTGSLDIREAQDGTCHFRLGGTPVSLFHYPYPLLSPARDWRGLPVASVEDIAAMKLSAIVGRGSRKDFLDLYCVCRRIGLDAVLRVAEGKFPDRPEFLLQAARALVYFEDAEKEPMPRLLEKLSWQAVKSYFERTAPKTLRGRLR
ncbi:MAG: nucleotidyl transferase AbiEii/AbiGii toxin family protein [Elusimicrobiota bacterium]